MPRKSFWMRLPFGVRMATAGFGVLAVIAGFAGGLAFVTSQEPRAVTAVGAQGGAGAGIPPVAPPHSNARLGTEGVIGHAAAEARAGVERSAPRQADRTGTRTPRRAATSERPEPPATRVARESETEAIRFRTRFVGDRSQPWGSRRVQTAGVPGERTLRYEVTYRGTRETGRRLVDSSVTRQPRFRVISFGTGRANDHDGGNGRGGGDRDEDPRDTP